MANVSLHPSAQREYQAAIGWYQERSQAAARRFVAEVDRVLAEIAAQPDRYGWYDDEFREAGLRRYPYSVVYRSPTPAGSPGTGKAGPNFSPHRPAAGR
jgi:toxin ParE1/3/4